MFRLEIFIRGKWSYHCSLEDYDHILSLARWINRVVGDDVRIIDEVAQVSVFGACRQVDNYLRPISWQLYGF